MSNIRSFKNTIPMGEPNDELIGGLEKLLAEAKTGELRAVAMTGVRVGSRPFTVWFNDVSDWDKLCTGVLTLHYRVGKFAYGDEE